MNALHYVLQVPETWSSFYNCLVPEDVAALAEVDRCASKQISSLRKPQHQAIVDAIVLNRIAPDDVNLFSFLEKNRERRALRNRTLRAVPADARARLWQECIQNNSLLSKAVLKAGTPHSEAELKQALSDNKVHVVRALLMHRQEEYISHEQQYNVLLKWACEASHASPALPTVQCLLSWKCAQHNLTAQLAGTLWGNHFNDQSVRQHALFFLQRASPSFRTNTVGFACLQVCRMSVLPSTDALSYCNSLENILKLPEAHQIPAEFLGTALRLAAISRVPATYTLLVEFCRRHKRLKEALSHMYLLDPRIVTAFFALPEFSQVPLTPIAHGLVCALQKRDPALYTSIRNACIDRNLLEKGLGAALNCATTPDEIRCILACKGAQLISTSDLSRALHAFYPYLQHFSLILDHCRQKGCLGGVLLQSLLRLRLSVILSIMRTVFRERFDVKVAVR